MKITGLKTTLFRSASASKEVRCVLELTTDEQHAGVAFGPAALSHCAAQLVAELLLNADPRAVTSHWQRLTQANANAGGTLTRTIAALDIALWDLKAKNNGESLWKTLGGLRPRVNSHARAPLATEDTGPVRAWCESVARRLGLRGIVLPSSGNAEIDTAGFVAIKETLQGLPAEISLMLDAGERWTPKEAIRAIREIEQEIDLTWIEAPAPRSDFLGLKRVSDSIRGAVCAGGKLTSPGDYLPHLHHHSINVVQIDIARVGITGALQIADAAYGFELPIALTRSPGNLHAHLAAVLPSCASIEVLDHSPDASIATQDVRIDGGCAIAGDRIGHGLAIDQEALRSAAVGNARSSAP